MTDVFKIIVKYRQKIIAKYRHLSPSGNRALKEFDETFLKVLDKHAPRKQKYIRANNSNYIRKAVQKEIMHRSRFRNKFLRERTKESNIAYNKQRNISVSL